MTDTGKVGGTAVNRTMDILMAVAESERALTVPELCVTLDLPKPTVHRLCQNLERDGLLIREPGGRHFAPGPKLLHLGLALLRWGPGAERRSILEKVVEQVGETCNYTTVAGDQVIYLDRVEARWPLRLHFEVGSKVPLHCTASGKLLLAHMEPARRARLLQTLELSAETEATLTERGKLEAELDAIARQGYSLDREEFMLGLSAIAVPIRDGRGRVMAALACHGPTVRFDLEKAKRHLPKLLHAAKRLGELLPG